MSYALPGPCLDGHQELQLVTECTTLTDVERQMLCNRCCNVMTFEDAVRNDERIKNARLEAAFADATILKVEPGGALLIGGFGGHTVLESHEALVAMVADLRERCGISMVYLFADEINVQSLAPETVANELLNAAERDPRVADALERFIAKRNRINGGASEVWS